ncbi:MAG: carotenoid oxygenase family protein [Pseudomonadota bacterium]
MARPFPNHPQLRGNYAPIQFEASAPDLVVEGEIPAGISGTLYRNGPNPRFSPRDDYHWFAGDGMLHAFHIANGRIDYANRWVRTPKFELETAAGEALFGVFGNPMTSDPSTSGKDSGVANTHVIWHGGKLLALEEGHAPFEVDPQTLAARGYESYGGGLAGAMTAHPKIDPATGQMHGFGYMAGGIGSSDMAYHVIGSDGSLIRSERFAAPYPAMVHDFALTEDYAVFPIFPLTFDLERAMSGGPPFAFEPEKGTRIGILKRGAPIDELRWVEGPVQFVFHYLNAWNTDETLFVDCVKFDAAPNFPAADGTPPPFEAAQGKLARWTIDLKTGRFEEKELCGLSSEFPRIDDRFAARMHRHGYLATASDRQRGDGGIFNEISHVDLGDGSIETWRAGPNDGVSEPVLVPKSDQAGESEAWVLATVFRAEERRSDLVILDAQSVAAGPVATARLDHRVPYGFHGIWRPNGA